jgi:hypothetical protein
MKTPSFFCTRYTKPFIPHTSGNNYFFGLEYSLFKSLPEILTRELPNITPSGLAIGTMIKLLTSLNYLASSLSPHRNSIHPFSKYEPFD